MNCPVCGVSIVRDYGEVTKVIHIKRFLRRAKHAFEIDTAGICTCTRSKRVIDDYNKAMKRDGIAYVMHAPKCPQSRIWDDGEWAGHGY